MPKPVQFTNNTTRQRVILRLMNVPYHEIVRRFACKLFNLDIIGINKRMNDLQCTSEQELRRRFDCNLRLQGVKKMYKKSLFARGN